MQQQSTLHDYLAAIRRRRWLLVGSVLAILLASLAYSFSRTPLYESTGAITYQKRSDLAGGVSTSGYASALDVDREVKTAAAILPSQDIAERAAVVLGVAGPQQIPGSVTSEAIVDTNLVTIRAVSSDPEEARRVAAAYATAFIEWRKEVVRAQLRDAEAVIKKRLEQFRSQEAREADPGTYYSLSSQLSAIRTAEALTNGNFELVETPITPRQPFSPNYLLNAALGLAAGVIVGIGLVLLAEQLDVRVRDVADLSQALEMPVIGRIPALTKDALQDGPLVVLDHPDGASAEAFRMLRGNLDFVAVDGRLRTIMVTSCTQAEGKSSTVCNLAVTLARAGKRVIVLEADLRRPKIHTYFGARNDVGLSSVIAGQIGLDEALRPVVVPAPGIDSATGDVAHDPLRGEDQTLRLLTSGPVPPNPGEIVSSERMTTLIAELGERCDVVLVDSPPFLVVGDSGPLAAKVDGLVMVMKLDHVTRQMVRDAVEFLRPLPCRKLGIVATNVPLEGATYRYSYYREQGETEAVPSATGGIPEDGPAGAGAS